MSKQDIANEIMARLKDRDVVRGNTSENTITGRMVHEAPNPLYAHQQQILDEINSKDAKDFADITLENSRGKTRQPVLHIVDRPEGGHFGYTDKAVQAFKKGEINVVVAGKRTVPMSNMAMHALMSAGLFFDESHRMLHHREVKVEGFKSCMCDDCLYYRHNQYAAEKE